MITADGDAVGVWDVATRGPPGGPSGRRGARGGFAPDGTSFAGTGDDGHAVVWDMASLTAQKTYATPAGPLASFAADGHTLFTAGPAGVYSWAVAGSAPGRGRRLTARAWPARWPGGT